jgi:hypothetical protein
MSRQVVLIELYVVNESLVPIIGTGCVNIDDEYQYNKGDYLGFSYMNSHKLKETQKDFHGEIHIPSEGKSLHIEKMWPENENFGLRPYVQGESLQSLDGRWCTNIVEWRMAMDR